MIHGRGEQGSLRVLLAGNAFSLPHGHGSTSRVKCLAYGLSAAGVDVSIAVTRASERAPDAPNARAAGVWRGVPYRYVNGSQLRRSTFPGRRLADLRSFVALTGILSRPLERFDAVMLFTTESVVLPVLAALSPALVLDDACELPFVYAEHHRLLARAYHRTYERTIYRLYDGMVTISPYLTDHFSTRVRDDARLLRIPALADTQLIAETPAIPSTRPLVAYAGNLDHPGEVPDLLRAFAGVGAERPDVELVVIGGSYQAGRLDECRASVRRLGLEGRVHFTGPVPHSTMVGYLKGASVLALPRRQALFSTAGFPTKLVEYLACERPVVVTRTGSIGDHLRHGENAYVVEPGRPPLFAKSLLYALDHPAESDRVARAGAAVARRSFDCVRHGRRLALFISHLKALKG